MKEKELIYFPSLTSFSTYFKKNIPLINDYSHRFYEDHFGEWAHKYFLLSAGSIYKKKNIRKELEMEDCLVFGDSGGFQIATGALKWDVSLREDIFNWLENNSDVAMNIDIPPVSKNYSFSDCIRITVDNMKWFEEHQTGKTEFLNVIQCQTIPQMEEWFDAVKGFKEFKGWGAGNVSCTQNFIHLIYLFLKNGVFEDKNFKWFHFLGKTSPLHYILYSVLQKKLNQYYPYVQVTTDSSTPAMQAVFGNWYHSVNYRHKTFAGLYYGNKGKTNYIDDAPLPCSINCPMCKEIKFKNIADDGGAARFYIAYHNLFLMNKALKDINILSKAHFTIYDGLIPKADYDVLKIINNLFDFYFTDKIKFETYYHSNRSFLDKFSIGYEVDNRELVDDSEIFGHESEDEAKKIADRMSITQDIKLSKRQKDLITKVETGEEINDFEKE